MGKTKKIKNKFGEEKEIIVSTMKVIAYKNKKKVVVYNGQIAEKGEFKSFTDWKETGTIRDIEIMTKCHESIYPAYSKYVRYNSFDNDPDKKIWSKIMVHVEKNKNLYFDEYGDSKFENEIDIPTILGE